LSFFLSISCGGQLQQPLRPHPGPNPGSYPNHGRIFTSTNGSILDLHIHKNTITVDKIKSPNINLFIIYLTKFIFSLFELDMDFIGLFLLVLILILLAVIIYIAFIPSYPVMPHPIMPPHTVMPHYGPYWSHGGQVNTGMLY
jgi:hypothetical protein